MIETDIRREGRPWHNRRDIRLHEMMVYDLLYSEMTGEHLPEFADAVERNPQAGISIESHVKGSSSKSSSSSSSSSQSVPQPSHQTVTQPQIQDQTPPPPPQQPPPPPAADQPLQPTSNEQTKHQPQSLQTSTSALLARIRKPQ